MKDCRVTQLDNGKFDIMLTDGKSSFCEDGIQAVQHAVLRLHKVKGESVTGNENEEGTDWYGIIFNAAKSRAEKELHIKQRILQTPGIKKFISFSFSQTGRAVSMDCVVLTDWGTSESLSTTREGL